MSSSPPDPLDPDGAILENRVREAQRRMWDYGIQGPIPSREMIIQQIGPLVPAALNHEDLRRLLADT